MFSRIYLLCLMIGVFSISHFALLAQPTISAIIPDICSPGMNVAVEILAPAVQKGAFGADGIYLNNSNDIIRVRTLNPLDSNKIIFSPFIVSWEGRVISVQAFVPPQEAGGPNPNSWDWSLLQNQFKIPICVTINGVNSTIDTLYIVQPFPFGNRVSESQTSVFGAGTWGKRSRSGAMIVDSMILPLNGRHEVSTNDCDPYREGNQGYLPFSLIVKGNVQGSGSIISVNANRQNGGPGGGGGAGVFCDITNPNSNAGNGYSGGAPGGRNASGIPFTSNYYSTPGIGTGNNGNGGVSGFTITGVRGGECRAFEGGGGGTGHPYGMSGSGSYGRNGEIEGFYGGGSSPTDTYFGGGGGYRTAGFEIPAIQNGGKPHGNRAVIPIAGGSGGATGNPRAGFGSITCSGYGGGGGGALHFHGNTILNISLEANGASGENNNPNGGGGSGGYIGIGAREGFFPLGISVQGGTGQTSGGEGRFRFDAPIYPTTNPNTYPMVNRDGQFYYRGATIEQIEKVDRSKILELQCSSGDSIDYYLKSQNGEWQNIATLPALDKGLLTLDFNNPILYPDSLYFLMAIQSNRIFKTKNEFEHEPIAIISQSAATILHAPLFPIIASDTIIAIQTPLLCEDDSVDQIVNIFNKGNGNLIIDSALWVNGAKGFSTVQPTVFPITIKAGDTLRMNIRFANPPALGISRDTLIINSNAKNDSTWNIAFSGKKEVIEYTFRSKNDTLYKRDFKLPISCIGTPSIDTISIHNKTTVSIPSDSIRLAAGVEWKITSLRNAIPGNDSTLFIIQYIPQDDLYHFNTLEVHNPICDTVDIIPIEGKGVETKLVADKSIVSKPNISLGINTTETITITNSGSAPAFIDQGTFGLLAPFQITNTLPALPCSLLPGDSLILTLSITMNTADSLRDTLEIISLASQTSCSDSVVIPVTAIASLPELTLRFGNIQNVDPKTESYEIPILYQIPGKDSVIADMTISFTVNGSVFYPKSVSRGILSTTLNGSGERIINILFNKESLPSSDSVLTNVKGILQLDTVISSTLNWQKPQWNSIPYATIQNFDGAITLDICEVGGQRLILNGTAPQLLLMHPNPAQSGAGVQIQFPINRLGKYTVRLLTMNGKNLKETSLLFNDIRALGQIHNMQLNIQDIASGTYFMTVTHEGHIMTEQLIIIP